MISCMLFCTEGLKETTSQLKELIPKCATCIVDKISQDCIQNLESAHTIPRLYRRTNREVQKLVLNFLINVIAFSVDFNLALYGSTSALDTGISQFPSSVTQFINGLSCVGVHNTVSVSI